MPGQTLSEIRGLLASAGLAPRHRFGQNFLVDLNLMRKLLDAAEVSPADIILEVGPGTGSLTEMLLERGARVIAVEIDRGLQNLLSTRLGQHPQFQLIAGDALARKHEINPQVIAALLASAPGRHGHRKLVANLPYQIATPLLMELLCGPVPIQRFVFTIQKEVAERLIAAPASAAYGPISVVTQILAQVENIAILPPPAFWPRPKVESAMLRIHPLAPEVTGVPQPVEFARFVQRAFQNRRKMLKRSLLEMNVPGPESLLERIGVSPTARAEVLPPAAWRRLFSEAGAFPA